MTRQPSLPAPDPDHLAALIFELAAQLHAERARRLALESWLQRRNILSADWDAGLEEDAELQRTSDVALEESMRAIMRILSEEEKDPRRPLRRERPASHARGRE